MKRDKQWLNNPKATRSPKVFSVKIYRDSTGELHLLGGGTEVYDRRDYKWKSVNTRAFGDLINRQGVTTA